MASRSKRKTAKKSAKPRKIPQPNGKGALYAGGVPGNKGGTGRPSLAFKQWCESLLDDPKCRVQVEKILTDRTHPAFAQMFRTIADRAHGKSDQNIKVKYSVDEAARELKELLDRGIARKHERQQLVSATIPTPPMVTT